MPTYYVSAQTGNDSNNGLSAGAAKGTLQAGLDAMSSAGDVVYIAPGIYRGTHDLSSAINGTSTQHNKIVGDPECEQFPGETPGIVRLTNTDSNNINAQVNHSTSDYVFYVNKLYTGVYNLHLDGGGHPMDSSVVGLTTQRQASLMRGQSDGYYNAYNCIAQMGYYAFYRMNTTCCIALGTCSYGFYQGYKHVHSIAIACYGGFYLGDHVIDCIAIGSYLAGFFNCDNVCNGISFGGLSGYRNSTGDEVHDSIHIGGLYPHYGGNVQGAGGIISGSYFAASLYGGFKGLQANSIFGPGFSRMQTSTGNFPNSTGFNPGAGTQGCKIGAGLLWSYNGAKKFIEACKPTLQNTVVRGKSDSHHDDHHRNYESNRMPVPVRTVERDILGHPRSMGIATHSLHNIEANITQRDLGPFEYSSVDFTSSFSQSGDGININGEGIQSFLVPVLSGSAFTASVNVQWTGPFNIPADTKPGILVKYAKGHSSCSSYSIDSAQEYFTGSQLIITSSYLAGSDSANSFHPISVQIEPSITNQIYDVQLQARATGSLVNSEPNSGSTHDAHFSDLEIT